MRSNVRWMAALLFLSGACALVFQNSWFRQFRLVFGASTPSFGAVLAIFMAGLGAGSAYWGRRIDRHPSPLRLYAALELGVALFTGVTPFLVERAFSLYLFFGGESGLGGFRAQILRLLLSSAVLVVPTFLMGGTFPAAAKAVSAGLERSRSGIGLLYGANTIGAVAGTFLSTFWLLELLGLRLLLWSGCFVVLSVSFLAWKWSLRWESPAEEPQEVKPGGMAMTETPPLFVLVSAAITGFSFFLLELVWYRMLSPLLGGSVFTFGLILAIALLGIGSGGILYGWYARKRPASLRLFSVTCGLESLFVLLPFALGDHLAYLTLLTRPTAEGSFPALIASWGLVTLVTVFPPSLVAGFQYPVLIALLGGGKEGVGRHVGDTAVWNTVGGMAGSFAGGFGMLTLCTAPGCWRLVGGILLLLQIAAALILWIRNDPAKRDLVSWGIGIASALLLFFPGPTAAWRHSGIGAGRSRVPDSGYAGFQPWALRARTSVLWESEGRESSVAVGSGGSLLINGRSDGSALDDSGTQILSPLIGALIHPHPRRALVIGLGTGSSAGWLAEVPSIERVDVIELEPAVIRTAEWFSPVNRKVLENPKVHLRIGDGREFLMTTRERYDVIFSEPSNPFRAGISSLFTREFYRAAREHLRPDGLFLQWLQAYEVDRDSVSMVYATIGSVFPHVETWQLMSADLLLVSSSRSHEHDLESLATRLSSHPFEEALDAGWRTSGVEGFLAHYVGGNRLTLAMAAIGSPNTDDKMALEFAFARRVGRGTPFGIDELRSRARALGDDRPPVRGGALNRTRMDDALASFLVAEGSEPPLPPEDGSGLRARTLAKIRFLRGEPSALDLWRTQSLAPQDSLELALVAEGLAIRGDSGVENVLRAIETRHPAEAFAIRAAYAWRRGDLQRATRSLEEAYRLYPRDLWALRPILSRSLGLVPKIAAMDAESGRRLLDRLSSPFPFHVLDSQRLHVVRGLSSDD